MLKTQLQVIDDAITVLHHSGAHLQVAAAQLDELKRVSPGLNAADTAQFQVVHHGVLGHLENEAQGDGFDSASREA